MKDTLKVMLIPVLAVATLGAFGLAACSKYEDTRGIGDAGVGKQHPAPRQVWPNIDKYPNVAAFCIGVNGVYTTTREAAPVVVPNDANCVEGGVLVSP